MWVIAENLGGKKEISIQMVRKILFLPIRPQIHKRVDGPFLDD